MYLVGYYYTIRLRFICDFFRLHLHEIFRPKATGIYRNHTIIQISMNFLQIFITY